MSKFKGKFKGSFFCSFLIKSMETFSINIGSSESSGIKAALNDLISLSLKDVPIEQALKKMPINK